MIIIPLRVSLSSYLSTIHISDDIRAWDNNQNISILEGFSPKNFYSSGTSCIDQTYLEISEIKDFYLNIKKIENDTLFEKIYDLPKRVNSIHNDYYQNIFLDIKNINRGLIEVSLHELSNKTLENPYDVEIKPRYLNQLKNGNLLEFSQSCLSYFISSVSYYSSLWMAIEYDKKNPKVDDIFFRKVKNALLQVVDKSYENPVIPNIFNEVQKEVIKRNTTIHYKTLGIPPLSTKTLNKLLNISNGGINNISGFYNLKRFIDSLRIKMTSSYHGKIIHLVLSPWTSINNADDAISEYISKNKDIYETPIPYKRWDNFKTNLEVLSTYTLKRKKMKLNFSNMKSCHSELITKYPLNKQSSKKTFKNHLNGKKDTLGNIYKKINKKLINNAYKNIQTFNTKYLNPCYRNIQVSLFKKPYFEIQECYQIDQYIIPRYNPIEEYCPLTPIN